MHENEELRQSTPAQTDQGLQQTGQSTPSPQQNAEH